MIDKIQNKVAPNPKQRSDLSPQSGSKSASLGFGVDTHDQVSTKNKFLSKPMGGRWPQFRRTMQELAEAVVCLDWYRWFLFVERVL